MHKVRHYRKRNYAAVEAVEHTSRTELKVCAQNDVE